VECTLAIGECVQVAKAIRQPSNKKYFRPKESSDEMPQRLLDVLQVRVPTPSPPPFVETPTTCQPVQTKTERMVELRNHFASKMVSLFSDSSDYQENGENVRKDVLAACNKMARLKLETCFDFQHIVPFHQNAKMPASHHLGLSSAQQFAPTNPARLALKMFSHVRIMIAHLCGPVRTS